MAIITIQAQIFDQAVTNGPDACATGSAGIGGPGVINLYFNGIVSSAPALGTILYYDSGATTTPVDDVSGNWIYVDYNFNTTPGISVVLNDSGEVIQIFDCDFTNNPQSLYSFLISTAQTDQTAACAASLSSVIYSNNQLTELLTVPTTLYTNIILLTPFNGNGKWFLNSAGTAINVNNIGGIISGSICNAGSSNVLTLSDSGWPTKDEACHDTASFVLYSATVIASIQTGDFLYTDPTAVSGTEYIPAAGDEWRAFPLDGSAYFIDGASGKIMAIEPCSSQLCSPL
jgi:hypothetical protein